MAEVDAYNYWPARGLVNEQLQSHSNSSGITIYSDFTGHVRTTLGLAVRRRTKEPGDHIRALVNTP